MQDNKILVDQDETITAEATDRPTFKVLQINARSLKYKQCQINNFIGHYEPKLISICEHWLNDAEIEKFVLKNYKLISRYCRINQNGGGVAIFASNNLEIKSNTLNIKPIERVHHVHSN